jgi:hypothetical protein
MSNRPLISQRIVTLAGRLAATKEDFRLWCTEIGIDVEGGLSENERNEMVYEIDALVSLMYKLSSSQVEAIFESFHRGWDYKPRLARVLEYFDQWKDK